MNAEMKFTRNGLDFTHAQITDGQDERRTSMDDLKQMGVVAEDCECSAFTLWTVAGGVLLAIGTVVYALISAI